MCSLLPAVASIAISQRHRRVLLLSVRREYRRRVKEVASEVVLLRDGERDDEGE